MALINRVAVPGGQIPAAGTTAAEARKKAVERLAALRELERKKAEEETLKQSDDANI